MFGRWQRIACLMQATPRPSEITFVDAIGRRSSPRLHLSVPAKLLTVSGMQDCLLLDVSQGGARIRLERPLAINTSGYLRLGPVEAFGTALWVQMNEQGSGTNGLEFDIRLSKPQVMQLCAYARNREMAQQREAYLQAHEWIMGAR